jgi:hypothetical protein
MFVVCEDGEVARCQHVVEMLYSLVDGQQLAVVCTILLLSWVQFLGKEGKRLPGIFDALL